MGGFVLDLKEINTISIFFRLFLAVICGGVIGMERGRIGRPAGFRTHILVCMGAAMAMMTNQFLCQEFGASDPGRLGAQVISGIGFLGAGTIIVKDRYQVKGLTTAAGLWASACMGLAIGIGFYVAAVANCILLFLINYGLQTLDSQIASKSHLLQVYIEFEEAVGIRVFLRKMKEFNWTVEHMDVLNGALHGSGSQAVIVTLRIEDPKQREGGIRDIDLLKEVILAEEI